MNYQHKFVVNAGLDEVAAFHRRSRSMKVITPPPIIVRMRSAPHELAEGDVMSFTLWMGPLPLHWTARIENVTPAGFTDRQLSGPFASWVHRHIFVPLSDSSTAVIDVVDAELSRDPFWRLAGFSMWIGMPALFAYRGWKTRQLFRAARQRAARQSIAADA